MLARCNLSDNLHIFDKYGGLFVQYAADIVFKVMEEMLNNSGKEMEEIKILFRKRDEEVEQELEREENVRSVREKTNRKTCLTGECLRVCVCV